MESGMLAGATLETRRAREVLKEIGLVGAAGVYLIALSFIGQAGDEAWTDVRVQIADAAEVLLDHIAWAFGAYIPVLLGFYAIVIGGQLVAVSPVTQASTRRTLAAVATMIAGSLLWPVSVIAAGSYLRPSNAWSLLLVVPATGVVLFLATQLGRFAVFEAELRLQSARREQEWTHARLVVRF